MLNSTLFALAAGSLSHSPLITTSGSHFRSHLCIFSYLFSPAIFSSKEMKSFVADHTAFKNIIGTGIILESKSYANQVFEENVVEKSSSITIQSCLFYNCITSTDNGGGLQVTKKDSSTKILNTGFTNCKTSANGGAFYIICKVLSVEKCCITSCTADEYDAFYFCNQDFKNEDEIKSTYVYSITPGASSTATIYIDSENPVITNNNFTSIRRNSIRSIFEIQAFESINFQYNSFVSCLAKSILYFQYFTGEIRNCNFDRNQANNQLVYFDDKEKVHFIFCCFMHDESKAYTNQYTWYVNCVFDHPFDEDKFPKQVYTSQCKFNSKYTTNDIEIPDISDNGCWALISSSPTEDTPSNQSESDSQKSLHSALYSVFTIAIVIVICIIAFFIYRCWKSRSQKDYILTMYAQV